jgi:hypothetical protein
MPWAEIVLSLIRCEFKAKYDHDGGWKLSAKGPLPIILATVIFAAYFAYKAG